jgi:hypothetical protein
MSDRPPSAAMSIWPHLKSQERPTQQQHGPDDLASVMYPTHVKPPPPPSDPYLFYLLKMGLIRTDQRSRS